MVANPQDAVLANGCTGGLIAFNFILPTSVACEPDGKLDGTTDGTLDGGSIEADGKDLLMILLLLLLPPALACCCLTRSVHRDLYNELARSLQAAISAGTPRLAVPSFEDEKRDNLLLVVVAPMVVVAVVAVVVVAISWP